MPSAPVIILTQTGNPDESGPLVAEAMAAGLRALSTESTPATNGMVLKMVDGVVGWFPARLQVPPIPYQAPVATTAQPVGGGSLASVAAIVTQLNLVVTEQRRLVESHNLLLERLLISGYMSPKPNA